MTRVATEELEGLVADHKTWSQPCGHPKTMLEDMVIPLADEVLDGRRKQAAAEKALVFWHENMLIEGHSDLCAYEQSRGADDCDCGVDALAELRKEATK